MINNNISIGNDTKTTYPKHQKEAANILRNIRMIFKKKVKQL